MTTYAQWQNSRKIARRIMITGQLELVTPAHFGGITDTSLIDISIQRASNNPRIPLLTGSSIAGALRNYLREATLGYGVDENQDGQTIAEQLFGYVDRFDNASYESWLSISDSLGEFPKSADPIELREQVAIDPVSRTAEIENGRGKKFDAELITAGTIFPLEIEFLVPQPDASSKIDPDRLVEALAQALDGFEKGKIALGLRKKRGLGQCKVNGWQVKDLNMGKVYDILAWLQPESLDQTFQQDIFKALGVALQPRHKGVAFNLDAVFSLEESSLLIRSSSGQPDSPDMVHLRSFRNGQSSAILSGTSLAGALRARAWRIARKFKGDVGGKILVDNMFGKRIRSSDDDPTGSCLIVKETIIEDGGIHELVQNRVKIDRFTGGAYPQALFEQQPVFGGDVKTATVRVKLELRQTADYIADFDAQVGLLLLLLKDLWTGNLPVGGESSNGRGTLRGQRAELALGTTTWIIEQRTNKEGSESLLLNENAETLDNIYLRAFHEWKPSVKEIEA